MYFSLDNHPLLERDSRSLCSDDTDFSIVERRAFYIRDWLHYQFESEQSVDDFDHFGGTARSVDCKAVREAVHFTATHYSKFNFTTTRYSRTGANGVN